MLTCSEPNVRIPPLANIPPSPACNNCKCSHQPSAAPPSPGSVSCHKVPAAVTVLRTFCTKTPSLAHFQSNTDRKLTATASCYESPCQCPVTRTQKNFSKLGKSGQVYTIRYPIDTLSIPDFRAILSRFASHLDALRPILDRIGHILAHMRGRFLFEKRSFWLLLLLRDTGGTPNQLWAEDYRRGVKRAVYVGG